METDPQTGDIAHEFDTGSAAFAAPAISATNVLVAVRVSHVTEDDGSGVPVT
jgi:hypothetical protein